MFRLMIQILTGLQSALTVNTRVIRLLVQSCDQTSIPISEDLRLQVLPTMSDLSRCAKHQFAAFIADRGILVVWDDQPEKLISRAQALEKGIMDLIWSMDGEQEFSEKNEKSGAVMVQELDIDGSQEDLRTEAPRRIVLLHSITTAATLCLIIVTLGAGYRKLVMEIALDHSYIRLALIAVFPPTIWVSFFFFQALIGNIFQIFGPISQVQSNTKYYSGLPPKRLMGGAPLPHVTIQCPVYKEGLQSVIAPTVFSIKAAISTYEMQGGTANIFINDDGMQLLSREEAQARQDFYEEHSIGWVARPRHDPKGEHNPVPFVRRGKFKKASNMNYALWVSNRVEDKMMEPSPRPPHWTQVDEAGLYVKALNEIIEEDENRTWADGNVRMGDYILLIDSDTRVPTDCLLDAVSEMTNSPQVAIIQYSSGVMNVTDNFFENGITFFTNMVYTQIKYAIANGDVAPFVGHNAILRWSAVQDIAYECEDDLKEKYWSEATVSEDFDMALRLQSAGYLVRFGAYTGDGFKEGVSLTVYDELARWEKYAYGCSELLFHPLRYWPTRGPFTKLFRSFITSGMPFPSKLTILSYIGTYYAIGCAWPLTLLNYFIVGWYNTILDKYYLNSFQVYLSIIVVFTGLGNVALAVLRYRLGEQSLVKSLFTNLMWIPLMSVFLGGLSLHVSQALLSHLVGIDMNWGATSKEAENTTFFEEVPRVIKKFGFTFLFCIVAAIGMVVLALFVPEFWRIDQFFAIYPLATVIVSHFMLPIALNPSLMLFTW
jgi:membrane glycosyltransferase